MGFFKSVSKAISPQLAGSKMIYDWSKNPDNIIGSIPYVGKNYWNQKNYEQQQQKLAWDQFVQYQTWGREDNAIQRRVTDLKNAGLSPVLAAGQPAQAGAVVSTTAPQRHHDDSLQVAMGIMSLLKMKSDITTQESQRELMKMQAQKASAEGLNALARIKLIEPEAQMLMTGSTRNLSQASEANSRMRQILHDLKFNQETGQVSNPGFLGQALRALYGANEESFNVNMQRLEQRGEAGYRYMLLLRQHDEEGYNNLYNRASEEWKRKFKQYIRRNTR